MKLAIRSMYVAPKGKALIAFDLSQAETWVVAHLANEYNMQDALKNGDIHRRTASILYNVLEEEITKVQRYAGKQNNHAQSYRMGAMRLMEVFNKNSDKPPYMTITLDEAKRMSYKWHSYYHLKGWWDEIEYKLNTQQRTLTTVYGFKRTFFGQWGDELFKEATAFEPQSTVGDHALGAIQPELGVPGGILGVSRMLKDYKDVRLVHSAYDSVTVECPTNLVDEIAPQVYKQMYRPLLINNVEFYIPVDGEVGERWGELEKLPKEKLAA